MIKIAKKKKILDLGFGPSFEKISKKFEDYTYYGIDDDPIYIAKAKKKGYNVKKYTVPPIPFKDNFFDLVYCSHLIEHLNSEKQHQLVKEINRVLKNKGKVIAKAPTPYNFCFYDEPTHVKPFTHKGLSCIFERAGFKTIKVGYTSLRILPLKIQAYLRYLAFLKIPWYCWETYYIGIKVRDILDKDSRRIF